MKSANELMNEIGEWAEKMFPIHMPDLGIAEEIGESIRCILKRAQKIREMDNDEKFFPALKDGFADITIYLLHLCFLWKVPISFEQASPEGKQTFSDRMYLATSLRVAAQLCEYMEIVNVSDDNPIFRVPCQLLLNNISRWAHKWGFDLQTITNETWERNIVKRRWDLNRDSAHKDVVQEA